LATVSSKNCVKCMVKVHYVGSKWDGGRCKPLCAYTSATVNESGIYTTECKGCHTISSMNEQNHTVNYAAGLLYWKL